MTEDKPSPLADLLAGAAWLVLAIAIVIGAWQMDRLEHLQASIYTVPGLVPGMLGSGLVLMSVLLMIRAIRTGALTHFEPVHFTFSENWRLIVALILCLGFSIGLVGHGLPFWLAAAIFVALFIFIYQYGDRKAAGALPRGVAIAVIVGLLSGLAIHFMFQDLFLVRLP